MPEDTQNLKIVLCVCGGGSVFISSARESDSSSQDSEFQRDTFMLSTRGSMEWVLAVPRKAFRNHK